MRDFRGDGLNFVLLKLGHGGILLRGHEAPVFEYWTDCHIWCLAHEELHRKVTSICPYVMSDMGLDDMLPYTYYEVTLHDEEKD